MDSSSGQRGKSPATGIAVSLLARQCRAKVPRAARLGMLCLAALMAPPATVADECESSTTARRLNIEKSTVDFEALEEQRGNYVATLKSGDLVMASFQRCGLGMHAHFYSRNPVAPEQRTRILRWFLAAVAPSQAVYQSLEKQMGSVQGATDKTTYRFSDANEESHVFEFKASETPLFQSVVHYTWNPPQH